MRGNGHSTWLLEVKGRRKLSLKLLFKKIFQFAEGFSHSEKFFVLPPPPLAYSQDLG